MTVTELIAELKRIVKVHPLVKDGVVEARTLTGRRSHHVVVRLKDDHILLIEGDRA